MTGKKPAIVLIMEKSDDFIHYHKAQLLSKEYNITLWYMKAQDYEAENQKQENDYFDYIFNEIMKFIYRFIQDIFK
jgi:hypothetical protein